jgi:hypothetical protein
LAAALLVLVQAAIGMVVNLRVAVPHSHPGAQPSNFFGGSFKSMVWAIGHGATALAIHAAFGLALVVMAIAAATYALRVRMRAATAWSVLAAGLVIGAGFNGAAFLDFDHDTNSLIMALLALGAVACYTVVLFLFTE